MPLVSVWLLFTHTSPVVVLYIHPSVALERVGAAVVEVIIDDVPERVLVDPLKACVTFTAGTRLKYFENGLFATVGSIEVGQVPF